MSSQIRQSLTSRLLSSSSSIEGTNSRDILQRNHHKRRRRIGMPSTASTTNGERICLVFGEKQNTTNLHGRLDCLVASSALPKELVAEKLTKIPDAPAKDTHSFTLRQAPSRSKKADSTEPQKLDFSTVCALLLSFEMSIQLVANRRRFLFQPLSLDTAILSEFSSPSDGNGDKPRVMDSSSDCKEKSNSDSSVIFKDPKKKGSRGEKEATERHKPDECCDTAWVNEVQNWEPISLTLLMEFYQTCLEKDDASPLEFVTQLLPRGIIKNGCTATSFDVNMDNLSQLVKKLLVPHSFLSKEMQERNNENALLLRRVRLQVMSRLQLYAMAREDFVSAMCKQSKKKKRRRHTNDSIVDQVTQLLALAPFLLPAETTFAQFVFQCIPIELYKSISTLAQEVFDYFEVTNPYTQDSDDELKKVKAAPNDSSDSTKKDTSKDPVGGSCNAFPGLDIASMGEEENKEADGNDDFSVSSLLLSPAKPNAKQEIKRPKDDLIQKPFSLTACAAANNSLLKGGKQVYVASHFNTNLSNMSSLFRQVKSARPKENNNTGKGHCKVQAKKAVKQTKPSAKQQVAATTSVVAETPLKQVISRRRPIDFVSETRITETPVPRRPADFFSETPIKSFISETPVKNTKKTIRFGGIVPRATIKPKPQTTENLSPPQPSALLVAQAALAATRKKR